MNLLLLDQCDFNKDQLVTLKDERHLHIKNILTAQVGDTLSVGQINGQMGQANILSTNEHETILDCTFTKAPPEALPLTVILALPRPKMLKRIIKNIAELGIKELYLINSYKVEKSYWQSPVLQESSLRQLLTEGLSQAKDTVLPSIHLRKRFKPFVEDELPELIKNKEAFIAHPYKAKAIPPLSEKHRLVVIGPESGFIDYEVELMEAQGMTRIGMGERIYKVENALTLLSTQLC